MEELLEKMDYFMELRGLKPGTVSLTTQRVANEKAFH